MSMSEIIKQSCKLAEELGRLEAHVMVAVAMLRTARKSMKGRAALIIDDVIRDLESVVKGNDYVNKRIEEIIPPERPEGSSVADGVPLKKSEDGKE